ncbi:hypothetical protein [Lentzea sp.]|uniref:hypothetical protein n=1 Tax=Lentzea sp. TaxID=56099 RepID=UPI002BBDB70B|nr:hypothetical protein [Lentzea sp.]HUQ62116.1 hypothetical protein [Lentzea sp.]
MWGPLSRVRVLSAVVSGRCHVCVLGARGVVRACSAPAAVVVVVSGRHHRTGVLASA